MNKRRKNDLREQRPNRWNADEVETMWKKNNPDEKVISESEDDSVDSIDYDAMKTEGWMPGEPSREEKKIIWKKMLGDDFDYDDDCRPYNPSDDDFKSIDSSDSCKSVNLDNQMWIHKKEYDSGETVKSDNQLGLDKKT